MPELSAIVQKSNPKLADQLGSGSNSITWSVDLTIKQFLNE